MQRTPSRCEKMTHRVEENTYNHVSDNELWSKLCEELLQLNDQNTSKIKKTFNGIDLNNYFSKEYMCVQRLQESIFIS